MRTFKLVNSTNETCDITTQDLFFHNPSGLGFEKEYEYRQAGNRFVVVNRKSRQAIINGKVALVGNDPYNDYIRLVQFLSKVPLVLKYVPNDQGGTLPSGSTYNLDVVVTKLEKTELTMQGYLDCTIDLAALGPWYVEKTIANGQDIDKGTETPHNLIWVNDDGTGGGTGEDTSAMSWIPNQPKNIAITPTLAEIKAQNPDNNTRSWNENVLVYTDGSTVTVIHDSDYRMRYVTADVKTIAAQSYSIKIPLGEDSDGVVFPGIDYVFAADVWSELAIYGYNESTGMWNIQLVPMNYDGSRKVSFNVSDDGYTYIRMVADFDLGVLNGKSINAPTITTNDYSIVGGYIQFGDSDESSDGIFAQSSEGNPTRITIYGLSNGDTIQWQHFVNGIEYSIGKVNDVQLNPDECLVVDCISVPSAIYKKNLITNEKTDVYGNSDFTTKRFITLQNGTNTLVVKALSSRYNPVTLNYKWEARVTYESV